MIALALVVVGSAPSDTLGAGLGRVVPIVVLMLAPTIAALAVVDPWRGLIAWIAVMPVLLLPRVEIELGVIQVTLSTLYVGAILAGTAFEWGGARPRTLPPAVPDQGSPRGSGRLGTGWGARGWIVGGAIIALAILSGLASPDPGGAAPIVLHGVIEPVLLGAIVMLLRPTIVRLGWLALAMGVSVVLASFYSLIRLGHLVVALQDVETVRTQISHLTYYNVGIYGDMLAMAMPLLVAGLALRSRLGLAPWVTVLLLIGVVADIAGTYATFAKSAWLGVIVSVSVVLLLAARTWRWRGATVVAGVLALALVVPYPAVILRALGVGGSDSAVVSILLGPRAATCDATTSQGEVSVTERVLATEAGIRMAIDHPLLGVGPGNFGSEYATTYRPTTATRALGAAHDFFPNLLAEFGVPMALLVVALTIAALMAAIRAYRGRDDLRRLLAAAFGAGLIGFLVVGTTFGVDLYRSYRVMNADVLFAGLLLGACLTLGSKSATQAEGEASSS